MNKNKVDIHAVIRNNDARHKAIVDQEVLVKGADKKSVQSIYTGWGGAYIGMWAGGKVGIATGSVIGTPGIGTIIGGLIGSIGGGILGYYGISNILENEKDED